MEYSMKRRFLCYILVTACILSGLVIPTRKAYAGDPVATVYQFLTQDMGLNSAAACGVMANIELESSFDPHRSVLDTNGKYTLGICQWNGGRKTALERFAGDEARTIEGQLKYLKYELYSSEYNAWNQMSLNAIPDTRDGAGEAARRWARYFERCAAYYCPSSHSSYSYFHCMDCKDQYQERILLAENKYWILYGDGSSDNGSGSASKSYTGSKAGKNSSLSKHKSGLLASREKDTSSKTSLDKKALKLLLDEESDIPMLTATKSEYKVGAEVELLRNQVTDASSYEVEVWKDDKQVFNGSMKKNTIMVEELEEGRYTAFLKVVKKDKDIEISEPYLFSVQEPINDKPTVFTVKTLYDYNEPVTLVRNYVPHTSYYWVTIWRDDKKIQEQNMVEPTFLMEHPIAGHYKITLQVGNSVSGQITSETFEFQVAEHDHVWNDGKITKEATDTEDGVMTYTCSCLATYTEPLPAKGHN